MSTPEQRIRARDAMRRWRAKQPPREPKPRKRMTDEERKERARESGRRWAAANPEKTREKQRRYRAANRAERYAKYAQSAAEWHVWVDALKLENGCVDCGYAEFPAALDFDHLPGTTKSYNVSLMICYSRARVLAEIAKCEVVCANCHRIRTAERRDAETVDQCPT